MHSASRCVVLKANLCMKQAVSMPVFIGIHKTMWGKHATAAALCKHTIALCFENTTILWVLWPADPNGATVKVSVTHGSVPYMYSYHRLAKKKRFRWGHTRQTVGLNKVGRGLGCTISWGRVCTEGVTVGVGTFVYVCVLYISWIIITLMKASGRLCTKEIMSVHVYLIHNSASQIDNE